jgi:hypothetical protein
MATSKPKPEPKAKSAQTNGSPAVPLKRGLPGTEDERTARRKRFAAEHRETLRRLGK